MNQSDIWALVFFNAIIVINSHLITSSRNPRFHRLLIVSKPVQSCDALLTDHETRRLLDRQFDLLILDGAYPECALALAHRLRAPFMYINTVGFYTGSLSLAGNPSAYSVSPAFYSSYTDDMTLMQRTVNTVFHVFANVVHAVSII